MQCSTEKENALLLNEGALNPKPKKLKKVDLNVWYLYNDASNHMTGQPSKFREWDEGITGLVESGDHWVMKVIKDVVDMGSTTLGNISSSIMLSDHYVVIQS